MDRKNRLERSGIGYINMMAGTVLGHLVSFYLFAWRIDIAASWIYFGAYILVFSLNLILLRVYDPSLLNERGRRKADIQKSDRLIVPFMLAFTYFIPSIVAGIEWRSKTGAVHPVCILLGLLLLLASGALENWAMLTNRHFELNIRIQNDRNHTVITTGPYKYIRHPGYLGYILRLIAFPLALGSPWSAIPVAVGIVIYIIRTHIEDTALKRELPGYAQYAGRTRYRLVPFIW